MTDDPHADPASGDPRRPPSPRGSARRPGEGPAARPAVARIVPSAVARVRRPTNPAAVFVWWFTLVIVGGGAFLSLPIASASGQWTPFLDALFTSTSAVCVTGLVVVDTGTYWSPVGQAAILLLIQVGGLGFMASSTVLFALAGRRAGLRERLLVREVVGGGGIGSAVAVARRIVLFTLGVEAVGAAVLTLAFLREHDWATALWWGVFHAVAAFTNAGFDLTGEYRSLVPYQQDALVLLTVALLLIVGGLSFAAVEDVAVRRRFGRLALDTKLVLASTAVLLAGGTALLLFTEWGNPKTYGTLDAGPRLLNAFFQAAVARTAGFASVNLADMTEASLATIVGLMFVGGASGSTAGGIKVQTAAVLVAATVSAVRGTADVEAFGRRLPTADVMRAVAIWLMALALVAAGTFALTVTDRFSFIRDLFEVASAFGTAGLSTGVSVEASWQGRAILMAMMFAGRLGPLTLALALVARERQAPYRLPEETTRTG